MMREEEEEEPYILFGSMSIDSLILPSSKTDRLDDSLDLTPTEEGLYVVCCLRECVRVCGGTGERGRRRREEMVWCTYALMEEDVTVRKRCIAWSLNLYGRESWCKRRESGRAGRGRKEEKKRRRRKDGEEKMEKKEKSEKRGREQQHTL